MKRIAIVVVIAAGLMMTSVAMAAHLSGTYRTKIHSPAAGGQLNGKWTITFKHGHYTVRQKGHALVHGRDSFHGHKVSLTDTGGPAACSGTGTYKFKKAGPIGEVHQAP